jgi:hypothetical protein
MSLPAASNLGRVGGAQMLILWRHVLAAWFLVAATIGVIGEGHAQNAAGTWPHTITMPNATVVVYQPQAIAWPNHEKLTARAALAITRQGEKTPIVGTVEISIATRVDAATGDVKLSDLQLLATHFPSLDTAQAAQLEERIKAALPGIETNHIPLNAVLLSLKEHDAPPAAPLATEPPVIFHSGSPASLVIFDGEPVLVPAGKSGLSIAVNTNWDVFTDGKNWYLLNNGLWLEAPAYAGPYKPIKTLPPAFKGLPADKNFADVRKAIPPKPAKSAVVPAIFVSTKPAEIIVTQGQPQFAPVAGTSLEVVRNTNSILFFEPASGRFFLLVSGRWFASQGLDGPWSFATDKLPPDFALISPNSPEGKVLAAVPGTAQAELAVQQAQVPRQATLKKDAAQLKVIYAGPPQFKPIPVTPLTYAVNTSFEVIGAEGHFYVCYQGAWFVGNTPNGPWALAATVPAVIYTIPPTSPLYNVTYVKVYAATPTTVTYGYTAGYTMGFVSAGVVVYGTGYYYPPVVIAGPVPIYYAAPYSYAGSVWYSSSNGTWQSGGTIYGPYNDAAYRTYYNSSTGATGAGGAIYGPNGGAGAFSYYNPSNGSYAHGSAAWNSSGGSANANYYNARTGISGSTNQNWNAYSRWGSSTFSGANQTVNTRSQSNAQGSAGAFQSTSGAEGAGYHSAATGSSGGAVKTQSGDVYAGHDGNVYQHTDDGWSKWDNGSWQQVNPPTQTNNQSNQNRQQSSSGSNAQSNQLGSSQQQQQRRSTTQGSSGSTTQSSQLGASQQRRNASQTMDSNSFQQLEQDRQARFAGTQQSAAGDRFRGSGGGGGFGERGAFGGGRRR